MLWSSILRHNKPSFAQAKNDIRRQTGLVVDELIAVEEQFAFVIREQAVLESAVPGCRADLDLVAAVGGVNEVMVRLSDCEVTERLEGVSRAFRRPCLFPEFFGVHGAQNPMIVISGIT